MPDHMLPLSGLLEVPLSHMDRTIVEILSRSYPRAISSTVLTDMVYAEDPDGGPDYAKNSLQVTVCRLRPKLEPYGWTIPRNATGSPGQYRLQMLHAGRHQ